MRVYIFRNDAEGLHAYTRDPAGENLPISLTGMGWTPCGIVPDLKKLFPKGKAQAIHDVVGSRGFYLFKLMH